MQNISNKSRDKSIRAKAELKAEQDKIAKILTFDLSHFLIRVILKKMEHKII